MSAPGTPRVDTGSCWSPAARNNHGAACPVNPGLSPGHYPVGGDEDDLADGADDELGDDDDDNYDDDDSAGDIDDEVMMMMLMREKGEDVECGAPAPPALNKMRRGKHNVYSWRHSRPVVAPAADRTCKTAMRHTAITQPTCIPFPASFVNSESVNCSASRSPESALALWRSITVTGYPMQRIMWRGLRNAPMSRTYKLPLVSLNVGNAPSFNEPPGRPVL